MTSEAELTTVPELVAQPRAMRTIDRLIDAGRAHAVLLAGEPENGPRAAAMHIAERVIAPATSANMDAVRQRVRRLVHPDVTWIAPEGGSISIESVREVLDVVTRMPFEAAAQVIVIDDADTLSSDNAAAGNSLLKALEEPAGRVVFVLIARRPARVLPTIRSRVIEVVFPAIPDDVLREGLAAAGIDDTTTYAATGLELGTVIRIARGDLARARSLATGSDAHQRRTELLPLLEQVVSGQAVPSALANAISARADAAGAVAAEAAAAEFAIILERMSAAEQRSFQAKSNDQGIEKRTNRRARRARMAELRACLQDLAGWWRDVLALSVGAGGSVTNVDRLPQLEAAAASAAKDRAVAAIDAVDEAEVRLMTNNADEPVTIGALTAELASLAAGRIRARRSLGAPARTPAGYDLALG
jgi:DNA polymerase-3 subunit delta'